MEHQISLTDEEVRKIVASYMREIAPEFTARKDIFVSSNSYSGLAVKVTISESIDSGEKEA
jgi:hypothetical protein